jgi:SAM-dependent methyltransferase
LAEAAVVVNRPGPSSFDRGRTRWKHRLITKANTLWYALSMDEPELPHNVEVTLRSYDGGIQDYLRHSPVTPHPSVVAFRERVLAHLLPGDRMLELGSGPGRDAAFFEASGIAVQRSDGTAAFVSMLREQGHGAKLLDVTRHELGEDFDAIFANAVLLHLTPQQLDALLRRGARAVRPGGLLAFTVKEGDGEAWTSDKQLSRYFCYWREPQLRQLLKGTGWRPESIEHEAGRLEPWLQVICRAEPDA